jgi:uncharacterized protein (TIGR03086 family)
MDATTTTTLLDQGFAWTAARIAAVPADRLDGPTPCTDWTLRQLLDHTVGSLTMLTDAVAAAAGAETDLGDAPALGPTAWDLAVARQSARSRRAWQAPGIMDRTFDLPIGTLAAPTMAATTLLEVVVHGWDIGRAGGDAADIPDELALPIIDFARQPVVDANRGDHFGADLGTGGTPSDQLVAFLGRRPW